MRMSAILLFLYLTLLGVTWNLIPAASVLVTSFSFQGFTPGEYGVLFVTLGLGGLLGAIFAAFAGEKRGVALPFFLSLFSYMIGYFVLGLIIISFYSSLLDFIFILVGHFFLGLGIGLGIPASYAMILSFNPKRQNLSVMAYSIPVSLGAFLGSFQISLGSYGIAVMVIGLTYLLLVFLCDFFIVFPKGLEEDKKISLQGLWVSRATMICVAIMDALFIAWTLLYFKEIRQLSAAEASWLRNVGLMSFLSSRIVITFLLLKFPFRRIYFLVPFLLSAISFLFSFYTSLNIFLMFALFSFFYSPFFPFVFVAELERHPQRPLRVCGELFGIFSIIYSAAVLLFGHYSAPGWFFPLAALLSFLIFIFNLINNARVEG